MLERIFPRWSDPLKRFDVDRFNLSAGGETLASWLSDDVGSQNAVEEFLEKFHALGKSSADGYIGTGNSCHVRAVRGLIFIENQFVEEQKVLLSVGSAIEILKAYGRFLNEARHGPDTPPNSFEVEFEMEGIKALEYYLSTGLPLGLKKS